jgi:hypothetical protein
MDLDRRPPVSLDQAFLIGKSGQPLEKQLRKAPFI